MGLGGRPGERADALRRGTFPLGRPTRACGCQTKEIHGRSERRAEHLSRRFSGEGARTANGPWKDASSLKAPANPKRSAMPPHPPREAQANETTAGTDGTRGPVCARERARRTATPVSARARPRGVFIPSPDWEQPRAHPPTSGPANGPPRPPDYCPAAGRVPARCHRADPEMFCLCGTPHAPPTPAVTPCVSRRPSVGTHRGAALLGAGGPGGPLLKGRGCCGGDDGVRQGLR